MVAKIVEGRVITVISDRRETEETKTSSLFPNEWSQRHSALSFAQIKVSPDPLLELLHAAPIQYISIYEMGNPTSSESSIFVMP